MASKIVWATLVAGAALCASAVSSRPFPQPGDDGKEIAADPRDAMDQVKISLGDALERAMRGRNGRAVEASLECTLGERGIQAVYEVDFLMPGGSLLELRISPSTGELLGTEEESDADESRAFADALRQSDRSLPELLRAAEAVIKGQAISIGLEIEDGPECEVVFVNGRYLIEANLESRAGHLIELELVSRWMDEDEEADHGHARRHDDDDDHHAGRHDDDDNDDEDEDEDEDGR